MTIFLLVLHYNSGKQIAKGGWSGVGKALSGNDPTSFGLYPTSIPPGVIVQKCQHLKLHNIPTVMEAVINIFSHGQRNALANMLQEM